MARRYKQHLHGLAASAIALAAALPASAQSAGAPAPAGAVPADADIIVTARRTEERLQDVPISITVFNQQQIDNRNITNGTDLATYTPSLTANARFGSDNASFAIRGFTQESRTTASVGTYFADVVAPRGGSASIGTGDGAGPGSFFDLQNVQVLKGPQGTLFGRNTTGGAVLLVPRKPTARLEGYAEGSYGNYDMKRIQAVLNVPLLDNARLRVGFDRMKRDGYLRNISGIGPDRFADSDYWAGRASLVVDLAPNLETYTILSYTRSDTRGALPQVQVCAPTTIFGALACDQIRRRLARGRLFDVQTAYADPKSLFTQMQAINTTTWRASDTLTVKNIASYSQLFNKIRQDFFGVDLIVPASIVNPAPPGQTVAGGAFTGQHYGFNSILNPALGNIANQANVTEELQLQGEALAGRLTYQLGGYLEFSDPLRDNVNYSATRLICTDRFALRCASPPGVTGALSVQRFDTRFRNRALYGQATYGLTDRLKLTGGIRYTWDTTRATAYNVQYLFTTGVPVGRCANTTLRPAGNPPITANEQCTERPVQKSRAPTWLAGIDYKPAEAVLLYAKYARGYRQGGVNPLAAGGFTTYDAEKVDSYEAGLKTSWRGTVPGTLNVSGFWNDLSNQQLALGVTSSLGTAPANNAIVNVGKSRLKGVEVEAGVGPFAGMRVDASYAYIDAKLRSTVSPVFPAGSPYDGFFPLTAGQPAPYTPKNKYTVTGTYALPLPSEIGRVNVGATYTFTDKQLISNTAFGTIRSYALLNLNLNWNGVAGLPVDLSLFATNVLNRKYALGVNDMLTSSQFVSYAIGQPRMYGARLRYSFGR